MRTLIHDFNKKELIKLNFKDDDKLINSNGFKNNCIGCFSCWIKHPMHCAFNDEYSDIVRSIAKSDELVIISKCRYGCYDSKVKQVLERCIGYVLPYFTVRSNAIHHFSRYDNKIKLSCYFYGDISPKDKVCVENLVKANAINLNVSDYTIKYFENEKELDKCIL